MVERIENSILIQNMVKQFYSASTEGWLFAACHSWKKTARILQIVTQVAQTCWRLWFDSNLPILVPLFQISISKYEINNLLSMLWLKQHMYFNISRSGKQIFDSFLFYWLHKKGILCLRIVKFVGEVLRWHGRTIKERNMMCWRWNVDDMSGILKI